MALTDDLGAKCAAKPTPRNAMNGVLQGAEYRIAFVGGGQVSLYGTSSMASNLRVPLDLFGVNFEIAPTSGPGWVPVNRSYVTTAHFQKAKLYR